MKRHYIATVQLLFYASDDADAADAVSAMLTENLQQATEDDGTPVLLDWQYRPRPDGTYEHATPADISFEHGVTYWTRS